MLQQASRSARAATTGRSTPRQLSSVFGVPLPSRSVRCHFREEDRLRNKQNTSYPYSSSSGSGYYGGYNDDPFAGVRESFKNLKEKWDEWPAEDRNTAIIYGSGAVLLLYIANAVLDSVERVPLVPGLLKFVGLIFSSWFIWRYLLFADGRRDLAQDATIDKIFGRVNDRVDDLSRQAAGTVDIARNSASSSSSSSRLSDNSSSGTYAASELDQNISEALHSMDKLADKLSE